MKKVLLTISFVILQAYAASAISFSQWLTQLCNDNWVSGELPKIEQSLKSGMGSSVVTTKYKSAIQHAMVTLAMTLENGKVRSTVKSFGYDLKLGMPIGLAGVFNVDTAPSANSGVDTMATVGRPAIETALKDLEVIPTTWTGSVVFTPSEWAFLDEEVAVDFGDILSLKACLNAALGALYFVQGYDCNCNYAAWLERWAYDIPVVAESKIGLLENGTAWSSIPFLQKQDGDDIEFPQFGLKNVTTNLKIARCGNTVWIYRRRQAGENDTIDNMWEWGEVELSCSQDMSSYGESFDTNRGLYQVKGDCVVYKINLTDLGVPASSDVKVKGIDVGYYNGEDHHEDVWCSVGLVSYLFLNETGLGKSVRNVSALSTAKTYVKKAIDLALTADAKIVARKDLAYHFFDYDQDSDEQKQLRAKIIAQLKKAQESLNGNVAVDVDLTSLLTAVERSDFGLNSTEKVNLNKLFTGDVTRKLAPPSTSTTSYISSLDRLPDPTFGGLFPAMTKSRVQSMSNAYQESQKYYNLVFDDGALPNKKCRFNRVYNLPCAADVALQFKGWRCSENKKLYDEKTLVFNLTKENEKVVRMTSEWGPRPKPNVSGVQLWENGPYWAECNVGAEKPEDYGYYFWWGDTIGYVPEGDWWNTIWRSSQGVRMSTSPFTETACPTYNKSEATLQSLGYLDATGNLVTAHDAARAHFGAPWRMPTASELDDLTTKCDTSWTTSNGVWGRLVKGRGAYASKSIFLPATGYGNVSYLGSTGSSGFYWSSTPYSDYYYSSGAWGLSFDSGYFYVNDGDRSFGHSVRPVRGFAK